MLSTLPNISLREKWTYSEFFWSVFSSIWSQYSISPYSVQIQEHMCQKHFEYLHFSRSFYDEAKIYLDRKFGQCRFFLKVWNIPTNWLSSRHWIRRFTENGFNSFRYTLWSSAKSNISMTTPSERKICRYGVYFGLHFPVFSPNTEKKGP